MAISSIGNGSDSAAGSEIAEALNRKLAEQIPSGVGGHGHPATGSVGGVKFDATAASLASPAVAPVPQDTATTLWQHVSSTDLAKLGQILQPPESVQAVRALDTLLHQAIQQVANGNSGRAVGYLADYATRDPKRAEALVSIPELEPLRAQIENLVGRMTAVAKMSAEDGLAKAGKSAEELAGKIPTWDTKPDVLVQLAQRLFEAGGYANYSRASELARALSAAAASANVQTLTNAPLGVGMHGLHATAQAGAGAMVPGVSIPYVVGSFASQQDMNLGYLPKDSLEQRRRAKAAAAESAAENWQDLKEVVRQVAGQVWSRAPLLVMMLVWLSLGITGGITASLLRQYAPDNALLMFSDFGFYVWALGFLGLVGFGFIMRVRRPRY